MLFSLVGSQVTRLNGNPSSNLNKLVYHKTCNFPYHIVNIVDTVQTDAKMFAINVI